MCISITVNGLMVKVNSIHRESRGTCSHGIFALMKIVTPDFGKRKGDIGESIGQRKLLCDELDTAMLLTYLSKRAFSLIYC